MWCVCPTPPSISVYWRPGSHSAAIFAASAWALSASRNSSTNRIVPTLLLLDHGCLQRRALVLVSLPGALEELHGRGRLLLLDLGQGEADVDQHPLAGGRRVVGEEPDVDHPPQPHAVHSAPTLS